MQKILICDREELFRRNLSSVLQSKGFNVRNASRPSEAVKCVLKEESGVIIFNMQPEDFNAMQIFSVIKTIDYNLPVIVVIDSDVTLSSISSIIHESFQLFQKPVDCNKIEEAVRDAVQVKANSK